MVALLNWLRGLAARAFAGAAAAVADMEGGLAPTLAVTVRI